MGSEGTSYGAGGRPSIETRPNSQSVNRRALKKSLRTNFNPGLRAYRNRSILRVKQVLNTPRLLAGGSLHRPVFIIGAPRSGTSMLFTILRKSHDLSNWIAGESHEVWERDFHPSLREWKSNAVRPDEADSAAVRRIKRSFFLATGARKRFIDKTPRNALRVAFIDSLFPDAQYLFLTRDGRENVNSLVNAWRSDRYRTYALDRPHSIPGVDPNWWKFTLYEGWERDASGPLEVVCAKQWIHSYEHALEAFESIERRRWFKVAYEGLVDDPVGSVEGIMDFLDLDYEAEVLLQAEAAKTKPVNAVTPPERGKWRRENPEEIRAIIPLITPTMRALGYDEG